MGRRRHLTVDPLEGRELLSITPILGLLQSPTVRSTAAGTGAGGGGSSGSTNSSGSTGGGSGFAFDPLTGQVQNQGIGGSGITTDLAPPLPNEVKRQAFSAKFVGSVQQQPPRLLDQSRQYYILAPGYTNQFLHGTLEMRYYTPNSSPIPIIDPATGLVARTPPTLEAPLGTPLISQVFATTGTLSMSDRSTQSGGVILANLIGSTANEDKLGRPTHFTLNLNGGGGSGGIYASSTGSGTVDLAYRGNKVTVTVHASIFINGIGAPLDVFQSNSHH